MNTLSIHTQNEIEVLNKETELKALNYHQVSENQKLKPYEYIKSISSGSEDTFGEEKTYHITWHK